jgi:predicted component of type VI protein secretion system
MPVMTTRPSSPAPAPAACLRVVSANGVSARFALPAHPVVIGTAPQCGLRLTDAYASRRHASIFRSDGRFLLEDLGSVNGTTLNGIRLDGPRPLRPGDVIGVGRARLTFGSSDGGPPSEPPRAPERASAALIAAGAGLTVAGAGSTYAALVVGLILLAAGVRRAQRR